MKFGGRLPESEIQRMGWSSGLVLVMMGGSISRGRRRAACATLVCTSCSATSMLRERSNSIVMLAAPSRDCELICLTPSIELTASSMKSTTSDSMISGDAPS